MASVGFSEGTPPFDHGNGPLRRGDVVEVVTPGAGGYGPPDERANGTSPAIFASGVSTPQPRKVSIEPSPDLPWTPLTRNSPMHLSRRGLLLTAAAMPFIPRPTWAQAQDSLVMGLSSYPPSLDPFLHGGTAAGTVKLCIFRGLTSFAEDGAVQPELAQSFEPESDTTWLFRLRDAVFHDGSPVTAEDVKWTIETVAAPTSTAYMRAEFQTITSVETPDDKTVRITTATPTVTLPLWFANFNMPIIKRDTLDNPVGAGPFTLASQDRGVAIDLEAFDRFYKPGLPKLRSIRMVAYADENLRVAALQAGDVDLIEYVPWQSMAAIESDSGLSLQTTLGPFMGIGFNGARGPFVDPRVRQAVAYAINRQDIVDAVFFGRGAPLESIPYDPASPFFNADLSTHWRYDPDRAMALLAEAGMDGGFECTLLSTSQYGMHKTTAEIVQQYLAQVNIAVTLNMPDWATRQALRARPIRHADRRHHGREPRPGRSCADPGLDAFAIRVAKLRHPGDPSP